MALLKVLTVIGLIASVAWYVADPGYEPAIAILASVSGLITEFFVERRNNTRLEQHQSVSKSSVGIQAGGDINIGTSLKDEDVK